MSTWHDATRLTRLLEAAHRAARGKKTQPAVARFLMDAERECLALQRALRRPLDHPKAWWPSPAKQFLIRDPKPRRISVAPFKDRVVHHTICDVVEPVLERYSIHHSYACWRGKGQHRALRQCQRFARRATWAFKGDISGFFASIPRGRLLSLLKRRGIDPVTYGWLARVIGGPRPGLTVDQGRGLPIGALTSQHLANFYMGRLDHWLTDDLGFGKYLRYMDDFVVFGSRDQLVALRERLRRFLPEELGLRLNEAQSRLQPVRDGISFLGFRVFPSLIRVSAERWRRFRRRQSGLEAAYARGELDDETLGQALSSQYSHLQHFDTYELRRRHLQRMAVRRGRGRQRVQPGHPWRLVEEQPAERAGCQPQQERALQPQRQPGVSRRELNARAAGSFEGLTAGPVGATSRSGPLCPGIDQTLVPCPEAAEVSSAIRRGTEPNAPGGGTSGVAAGPLLRGGS